MSASQEVVFTLDLPRRRQATNLGTPAPAADDATHEIPRVARLLALAIRLERLVATGEIRDYAEVARRGKVTRARLTRIMKLCDLAPDLQETILFLPPSARLKERDLRPVTARSVGTSNDTGFGRLPTSNPRAADRPKVRVPSLSAA